MRPTFDRLTELYIDQRLTSRQIGELMHVSKTEVLRWLKRYNIQAREPNNGMSNRQLAAPTKEELIDLVHTKHQSYEEIAALYKCDKSMIRHWLIKYDLSRPKVWDTRYKDATPVMPTEEVLRDLYETQGLSIMTIGAMYGTGPDAMRSVIRRYGIQVKLGGWTEQHYLCKDGHNVMSTFERRVDDWLYEHEIPHEYAPMLPFDHRCHADFLARGYYIEVWGVTGDTSYAERRKRKTENYKKHKLPLIEISKTFMTRNIWREPLSILLQSV